MSHFTWISLFVFLVSTSLVSAQELVNESYFPLDKELRKNTAQYVDYDPIKEELCITMEAQKRDKVKGQKRIWDRVQLYFDNSPKFVRDDLLEAEKPDFKTPEFETEFHFISTQLKPSNAEATSLHRYTLEFYTKDFQFQKRLNLTLCKTNEFDRLVTIQHENELLLLVQFHSFTNPSSTQVKYFRIDLNTIKLTSEKILTLAGSSYLGCLDGTIVENKLTVIGKTMVNNFTTTPQEEWKVIQFDLAGNELKQAPISIPLNNRLSQGKIAYSNGAIVLLAEYGPQYTGSFFPVNATTPPKSKKWYINNAMSGLFLNRFDAELNTLNTQMFSYANHFSGIHKGQPATGFNWQSNFHLFEDIQFLPDGSSYLTSHQYRLRWQTRVRKKDGEPNTYTYSSDYEMGYLLVFRITTEGNLDWVYHLNCRQISQKVNEHTRQLQPQNMALKSQRYLVNDEDLVLFYDFRNAGLIGNADLKNIVIKTDGSASAITNYNDGESFDVVENGIVDAGGNQFYLIGYDKKKTNLIVKKVAFQ